MKVAIIGAGMSGLLAAKACVDCGIVPHVYAKDMPGGGHGIRYLHNSCGLPINPIEIETSFVGVGRKYLAWDSANQKAMADLYAQKTGASFTNNSIHRSVKIVRAYDWNDALDMLQGFRVEQAEVKPKDLGGICKSFDLVINTAPLMSIYPRAAESCNCREMYVTDRAPRGYDNSFWTVEDKNVIVYNVNPDDDWTRYSRVEGVQQTEYKNPVEGYHRVIKVEGKSHFQRTHSNMLLVGRYGAWDSTYMAHQAYFDTLSKVKEMIKTGVVL